MQHKDEGLLQAWLDGPRAGLTEEERAGIESHLAGCAECAARLEALRAQDAQVASRLSEAAHVKEDEIPDFSAVVARAGRMGGEDGGAEPTEGRAPGGDAVTESPSRRPMGRGMLMGWAASLVVALGVGWIWNEMQRPGPVDSDSLNQRVVAAAPDEVTQGEEATAPLIAESEPATSPTSSEPLPPPPVSEAEPERLAAQVPADGTVTGSAAERESVALAADATAQVAADVAASGAAAPTPVAAESPAPTAAMESRVSRNIVTELWRPVTMAEAEAESGFDVRVVPGLEVLSVELAGDASDALVRVRQQLEGGEVLTLVASRMAQGAGAELADADLGQSERALTAGDEAVRVLDDGVQVTAQAPSMSADSLAALLATLVR